MAARLNRRHQEFVREKIRSTKLIQRLEEHALGDLELSTTQIKAIEILLRKCIPDLSAVEHSGEIARSVSDLTDDELSAIARGRSAGVVEAETGAQESPSVH